MSWLRNTILSPLSLAPAFILQLNQLASQYTHNINIKRNEILSMLSKYCLTPIYLKIHRTPGKNTTTMNIQKWNLFLSATLIGSFRMYCAVSCYVEDTETGGPWWRLGSENEIWGVSGNSWYFLHKTLSTYWLLSSRRFSRFWTILPHLTAARSSCSWMNWNLSSLDFSASLSLADQVCWCLSVPGLGLSWSLPALWFWNNLNYFIGHNYPLIFKWSGHYRITLIAFIIVCKTIIRNCQIVTYGAYQMLSDPSGISDLRSITIVRCVLL